MRLTCFHCGKSVSNEIPNDTVVRAVLECPECAEKVEPTPSEQAQDHLHTLHALAAAKEELESAKLEITTVLGLIPGAVRVRESGGLENIYASLAVSVGKLNGELERVQRELDHKKMWANEIAACTKEELEKAHKEIERVKAAAAEMRDAAEMLWTVVANVSGGDWTKQSDEWQTAAARWRDAYHKALAKAKGLTE